MRKLVISMVATALASISLASYADPFPFPLPTGYNVSVEGGYGALYTPRDQMGNGGTYQVGGLAWGANLGYDWGLDSYSTLGLEAGFQSNPSSKYNGSGAINDTGSLEFNSNAWDFLLTFKTYWANGFSFFAKAGAAYLRQTEDLNGPIFINNNSGGNIYTQSGQRTDDDFEPMLEMGMGYLIMNNVNLYGDISYIFGHDRPNFDYTNASNPYGSEAAAAYALKVGISYNF